MNLYELIISDEVKPFGQIAFGNDNTDVCYLVGHSRVMESQLMYLYRSLTADNYNALRTEGRTFISYNGDGDAIWLVDFDSPLSQPVADWAKMCIRDTKLGEIGI